MPRYKGFTHSQSLILGYLISAGGNAYAGSTVKEIIEATNVSPNAAYRALKQGIPGVETCKAQTKTGAVMYWANPATIVEVDSSKPTQVKTPTIWDTDIWQNVSPEVFAGLSATHDKAEPSWERLMELIKILENMGSDSNPVEDAEYLYRAAILGQVIAIQSLALVGTL